VSNLIKISLTNQPELRMKTTKQTSKKETGVRTKEGTRTKKEKWRLGNFNDVLQWKKTKTATFSPWNK